MAYNHIRGDVSSKKTYMIIHLIWWGSLRLASIMHACTPVEWCYDIQYHSKTTLLSLAFYHACSIQVDQATSGNLHNFGHVCALCLMVITFKHRARNHSILHKLYHKLLKCYMLDRTQARVMLSVSGTISLFYNQSQQTDT